MKWWDVSVLLPKNASVFDCAPAGMPHLQGLASYPSLLCFFVGFGASASPYHMCGRVISPPLCCGAKPQPGDLCWSYCDFCVNGANSTERTLSQTDVRGKTLPVSMHVIRPQRTNKRSSTAITQIHNPVLFKHHCLTIKRCTRRLRPPWKQLVCHRWRLYSENKPQFSDPKSFLMCIEPDVHSRLDVPSAVPEELALLLNSSVPGHVQLAESTSLGSRVWLPILVKKHSF